jgi:hypothetical protein
VNGGGFLLTFMVADALPATVTDSSSKASKERGSFSVTLVNGKKSTILPTV